jgi:hypothetical protein
METNHTVEALANLSKVVSLDDFYCITMWKQSKSINLQGKLCSNNLDVAKALDIHLVFDNESMMLNGETNDKMISITLTT